ncbi:MAG: two-component system response regulator KdpE [Candidatus Hydrogenedentes bacterium]|nr:two-component system response regulator KdpE [Candidatus Hydrogenedentota bacterium]
MTSGQNPAGVLVVEDDEEIRRFVRTALKDEGYVVFEASTLSAGLVETGTRKPELVILDLGLPDGDGVDFIRDVRSWSSVPIVVLSARVEEPDKVRALDAGADDYLSKPFGVAELLARTRAALRRTARTDGNETFVRFGDIELDLSRRMVTRGSEQVRLTKIEYRLLTTLVANAGKVLTHRQLLRDVWGPSYIEHNHYLRIYMAHLRQKLEADPTHPKHFITETGVGYRFTL